MICRSSGRRALFSLLVLSLVLSLVGCFDYRERIVFKKDLSGVLNIAYTVPVHSVSGRSALAFLPIDRDAVVGRYSSLFFLGKVDIQDYTLRYSMGRSLDYPLLAHVRYAIHFKSPAELERLLLGRSSVITRKDEIVIRRTFPVTRPLPENASRLPRRILSMVREHLEKSAMAFRVEAPAGYEIDSSHGDRRNGSLLFRLPLEETLSAKQDFAWRVALVKK